MRKAIFKAHLLTGLILVSGIVFSAFVTWKIHGFQNIRAQENFHYLADRNHDFLRGALRWHSEPLYFIGSLILASDDVTDAEFDNFARSALDNSTSYDALGWIAYDPDHQSFHYRLEASRPAAHTVARTPNTPITPQDRFYTILEASLAQPQKDVAGYSLLPLLSQHSDHIAVNNTTINIGVPHYEFHHIVGMLPVYYNGILQGLSYSILNLDYLVRDSIGKNTGFNQQYIALKIYLEHEPAPREVIYQSNQTGIENSFYKTARMDVHGGTLVWEYRPTQDFMQQYSTNTPFIIFMILCFLSLSITVLRVLSTNIIKVQAERDKAREISRLKSDFLATMSHEIRTPMNGILGMAELILSARPDPRIGEYAQTIINSGESLQHIIDDILDFSKIEANKLDLDICAVDMLELADDLAVLYATQARDKALELVVRYKPGSAQFVMADPARMRQILGNLIHNAIKFTDKGHVALTIKEKKGAAQSAGKIMLEFCITDTGIGMSEAQQKCIFDKFTQADTTTTRKYGGTGLGLSISKNLITLMGGTLSVESVLGQGTCFTVSIPFTQNADQIDAPKALPPRRLSDADALNGLRLLIVDDLTIIHQLVAEQLTPFGIQVDTVPNGHSAIEKLIHAQNTDAPYHITLIDYLMPDMNGAMLASAIHDHPQLRDICLIMLSAAGNPVADERFVAMGFSAYIAKPVRNMALIESIALIWGQYSKGERGNLIKIDTSAPSKDNADENNANLSQCRILVAEDNLVNQVFIREILESLRADYTIVSNGAEALSAYQKNPAFDLIVMDCLMPEMDGFEATRLIRAYEKSLNIHAIPILALTANAMKGDREKCLDAGMDDYLSKPVRKDDLEQKIFSLTQTGTISESKQDCSAKQNNEPQSHETQNHKKHNAPESGSSTIIAPDMVKIARETLKDKYPDMLQLYITTSRSQIAEIRAAFEQNNIEAIIRPAHTLKSTSLQMGAIQLSETARSIESAARIKAQQIETESQNISSEQTDIIRRALKDIEELMNRTGRALEQNAA